MLWGFAMFIVVAVDTLPDTSWIERGGTIGLLGFAVVAFFRGWIHTDQEFRKEVAEKEFWRDQALGLLQTAQEGVHTAKELVSKGAR